MRVGTVFFWARLPKCLFERDAIFREIFDELTRLVAAARGVDGEVFHLVADELAEARFGGAAPAQSATAANRPLSNDVNLMPASCFY